MAKLHVNLLDALLRSISDEVGSRLPTAYIMRIEGYGGGLHDQDDPLWLESFDHDTGGQQGFCTLTRKVNDAMRFDTKADALIFWRKQSRTMPLRPDGHPNRPLTAYTVKIEELP
jgi:hypothetical protein